MYENKKQIRNVYCNLLQTFVLDLIKHRLLLVRALLNHFQTVLGCEIWQRHQAVPGLFVRRRWYVHNLE